MALAGYDPREAPEFWKRMASLGDKTTRNAQYAS